MRAMNIRSYVVRIYRRGPARAAARSAARLVGIVENTLTGERVGFRDIDELWAVLARPAHRSRRAISGAAKDRSRRDEGRRGDLL